MIIKKVLPFLVAMLMILSTAAGASAAGNSTAVNTTSFTTSQISQSAGVVISYVNKTHSLPNNVTVGNKQVTPSQYLYLLTTATQNVASSNKSSIALKNVSTSPNPIENVTSGNINQTEYLKMAKSIDTFIAANGRLPNYISTSLGNMKYQSLIYMYSNIMNFYKEYNRLPNYVSVNSWTQTTLNPSTYGPSGYLNGTAKFNETQLSPTSITYGKVLKLGSFGTGTNKVAIIVGIDPQEVQAHIAMLNAIEALSKSLNNIQITVFDVIVYNGTDYTTGRDEGQYLAQHYIVPNINTSYKLVIDDHGNRGLTGYLNAAGEPITDFLMAPDLDAASVKIANELISSKYTKGTLVYHNIPSADSTSPPVVTIPIAKKGIPTLIFENYLNQANYAQVLYVHALQLLEAVNAIF
ncbi:MAG: pseudomurein-binding repeat-containing protein [Methanobacterium sp.]